MAANSVTIEGRLGSDPEKKGNENGPVLFTVCWNQNRKLPSGEWESTPNWFDVKTWGKTRDTALGLRKGDLAVVEGRLKQEVWEKDGQKRSKLVIEAQSVAVVPKGETPTDDPDW